jgi:hypothetical protein
MYNHECQKYLKLNPGINITKYDIAQLTSKPYLKALTPENLISAFRRTGIFPFNKTNIADSQVAPSIIYKESEDNVKESEDETTSTNIVTTSVESQNKSPATTFFSVRTIKKAVKPKQRKFVPPFKVSGNLLLDKNIEILTNASVKQNTSTTKHKNQLSTSEPKPSTSGLVKSGGPINLEAEDADETEDETTDDERCCVCNRWEPADLHKHPFVTIVSWGKCDHCSHWTHLKFCSTVRVLRRKSEFRCPHCLPKDN